MGFWYLRIFGCHVYNGTLGLLLTAAPCEGQSLTQQSDTEIKLDKSEETSSQSLEKLTNNHHNHHHHTQTHTHSEQWAMCSAHWLCSVYSHNDPAAVDRES